MELSVFSDCRILIENFIQSGDSTFKSFCQQWKAMAFQQIFSAQSTNVELMQTTAAALHVAKNTVCGRGRDEAPTGENEETQCRRRIGGIFLMYAIYFKQPLEEYMKVEVSPKTWQQIKTFVDTHPPTQDSDEVRFIFFKLVQSHAFRFTAVNYCVGLENLVDFDEIDEYFDVQSYDREFPNPRLAHELPVFNDTQNILPAFNVLEEGYNEMKEILTKVEGVHAQSLPPTNIFKNIKETFQAIQDIINEPKGCRSDKKNTTQTLDESKKRHLKRKGYSVTVGKNKKSDKTELPGESNHKEINDGSSHSKRAKRMSARTIFSEPLPKEMLRDLQEQSDNTTDEQESTNSESTEKF